MFHYFSNGQWAVIYKYSTSNGMCLQPLQSSLFPKLMCYHNLLSKILTDCQIRQHLANCIATLVCHLNGHFHLSFLYYSVKECSWLIPVKSSFNDPWKVHLKTVLLMSISTNIISTEGMLSSKKCPWCNNNYVLDRVLRHDKVMWWWRSVWHDKSLWWCVHNALCVPLNTEWLIFIAQSLSFGIVRMLSLTYVQW